MKVIDTILLFANDGRILFRILYYSDDEIIIEIRLVNNSEMSLRRIPTGREAEKFYFEGARLVWRLRIVISKERSD
ncbi:MAG: hypothetical protein AB1432_10000 [Bacteroidota bacterium]